jgi:hypothetical protein
VGVFCYIAYLLCCYVFFHFPVHKKCVSFLQNGIRSPNLISLSTGLYLMLMLLASHICSFWQDTGSNSTSYDMEDKWSAWFCDCYIWCQRGCHFWVLLVIWGMACNYWIYSILVLDSCCSKVATLTWRVKSYVKVLTDLLPPVINCWRFRQKIELEIS